MNKLKNKIGLAFFIALLVLPLAIIGQDKIQWGPEVSPKKPARYNFLGHSSKYIYIGTYKRFVPNSILKFGKDKKLKETIYFEKLIDKKLEHVVDFSFSDDYFIMLILRKVNAKPSNSKTYLEKLTIKNDKIIKREELHEFKGIDYVFIARSNGRIQNTTKHYKKYDAYKLRNQSKLLLSFDSDNKGGIKTFFLFDRENNMDLINQKTLTLSYNKNLDIIEDVELDNENNIYLLTKKYLTFKLNTDRTRAQKAKGKPNYYFSVSKINSTKNKNLDIEVVDRYWISADLGAKNKNEIYLAAYYVEKFNPTLDVNTDKAADGILFYKFNSDLEIKSYKDNQQKAFQKREGYPRARNILKLDDNSIYLLSEYYGDYTNRSQFTSLDKYLAKNGIYLEIFDTEGNYKDTKIIARKAHSDYSRLVELQVAHSKESINLFYNANEDYIKNLKINKNQKVNLPIKKNRVVNAKYDSTSKEFNYKELSDEKGIMIGGNCLMIEDEKYYFLGFSSKFSKLRLGTIE